MRAVQTLSWEEGPRQVTLDAPTAPTEAQLQLRMKYVGLHAVVRSRASGRHYSASALPHTLGVDGVGVDEATGRSYFVVGMAPGFGTAAELLNVDRAAAVPLPEGADAAALAASVNPGMGGWLALRLRAAGGLPAGFTALVLGATSASGELAVPLARALGASAVVGAARSMESLARVPGLDRRIELGADGAGGADLSGLGDVDVILDYVGGDVATWVLKALPAGGRAVQYVQIGTLSGQDSISVPAALLRSRNLTIRGSGPGAFTIPDMVKEMPGLVEALAGIELKKPQLFPLDDFDRVWADKDLSKHGRIVFTL